MLGLHPPACSQSCLVCTLALHLVHTASTLFQASTTESWQQQFLESRSTLPPLILSTAELYVQILQERVQWLSSELDKKGIAGTEVKVLKAFEVFDETLADQFSILAGKSRGPVPL